MFTNSSPVLPPSYTSTPYPKSSCGPPNRFWADHPILNAQSIIAIICAGHVVHKLILGHTQLGDDGCATLFAFLGSTKGRTHPVNEISINSNSIGDRGLLAISEYLKGNNNLKELFLQNNEFRGVRSTISIFVDAVNSSRLENLSLTMNGDLGDSFIETFLPALDSPHLREVHFSAIGLTHRSLPHLVEYLSSPRCRLHTLKCNGNALGARAVNSIISVVEKCNYGLVTLELYSNHITEGDAHNSEDEDDGDGFAIWKASEARLRHILARNMYLKRETVTQALYLLRHARPLLLCSAPNPDSTPRVRSPPTDSSPPSPSYRPSSNVTPPLPSLSTAHPEPGPSPSVTLPPEIYHHILSFVSPILSPTQRIRIYHYASSPATLPPLLPQLRGVCNNTDRRTVYIPDPSSQYHNKGGGPTKASRGCGGLYMERLMRQERDRLDWLAAVGCGSYDSSRQGLA